MHCHITSSDIHIHNTRRTRASPDGPAPQALLQGGVSGRGRFDFDSIDPGFFDVLKALHRNNTLNKLWESENCSLTYT